MYITYIKHNTRQAKNINKIKTKNKYGSLFFINCGVSYYNNLSSPIKKSKIVFIFKRKLKRNLADSQLSESIIKKNTKMNFQFNKK